MRIGSNTTIMSGVVTCGSCVVATTITLFVVGLLGTIGTIPMHPILADLMLTAGSALILGSLIGSSKVTSVG